MSLAPRDQFFVVHVLSGQEQKVHDNIQKRIKTEEMEDVVFDVLIPTERVQEIKRGKKTETTRKFFPGYIIINMHLLTDDNGLVDRSWYFIRETTGVIGFAGSSNDRPIPMRKKEVEGMLAQMKEREESVKPKIEFEVGDKVKVADGPVPESEWRRRGDRPRARKTACFGQHLRPGDARGTRILASREGLGWDGRPLA